MSSSPVPSRLSPLPSPTLHMIGNGHIDPVWLWQWQEGFQEVLATFRSALDRMDEYPDFCFTASSAAFYSWVERIDPAMFREIQARVAEGRWELAGGWWIEPDCNVPCGESLVRQGLYGQRYFRAKFGVTSSVGYAVDSFGHNAALPQILRKSGLDAYIFMRPGPHEKALPGRLFWWESEDGSRVLTHQVPRAYCVWGDRLEPHIRSCAADLSDTIDQLMCFYGVGNHGGGPTVENIACIQRLDGDPALPRLAFSTPSRYFRGVPADRWDLPVVRDELQHHASGCYAAHSGIKRWNRLSENALMRAEKWSAIAALETELPYPRAALKQAWEDVLFNQFHDIIAGTSLEVAYEDARDLYGEATTLADRALNDAAQSMAWHMAIPHEAGVVPVVVFNANAWPSRIPVQLEVQRMADTVVLLDDAHKTVPVQQVRSHATAPGRRRIAFIADLPALGYRVHFLSGESSTQRAGPTPASPLTPCAALAPVPCLANARFHLTFDTETGYLTSLRDKVNDVEVLSGAAARPVVIDDPSDTWSHGVFAFANVIGAFEATRITKTAEGPVCATLRVESAWGRSTLTQEFTLYRDLERIDVAVTVDWQEKHKMLKLRFPVNVTDALATHEIPYGYISRAADGVEQPIQRWVDLTGTAPNGSTYGLSVLNDGKPSVDVTGNEIGLTVLRSPAYAHHMPAELDPDTPYAYIDQGEQRFTYSLYPHTGDWRDGDTVRHATALNQPPVALIGTDRPTGTLPLSASFASASPDTVSITVLKQAEDGKDVILRAYETAGRATRAVLSLPAWGRSIEADFLPGEIRTWRIPTDSGCPALETNLLEDGK